MSEQRTEEWRAARAGKLTASRFKDVIGTKAARSKYMREIVFERAAGAPTHEISGKALAWGSDVEPYQCEAFELQTGLIVTSSPFVLHPVFDYIGASPDGLIGSDAGIEMKSPHDEAVHIATWLNGMPGEHMAQVQGAMAVTGRSHWYFTSYDPRQTEKLRLYIQRIERDEEYIAGLLSELCLFNMEANEMLSHLMQRASMFDVI